MGFVLLEKEITVFDEANVILESGELPPITTVGTYFTLPVMNAVKIVEKIFSTQH